MFLDFSGCEKLYFTPDDASPDATIERTVRRLTDEIQSRVGLPASAGIATSRSVAKVASGVAKPHGVRLVPAGRATPRFDCSASRKTANSHGRENCAPWVTSDASSR